MYKNYIFKIIVAIALVLPAYANADIIFRGYIKEMPSLMVSEDFSKAVFSNTVHNRLNFHWNVNENLNFHLEGRNRILYNEIFNEFPDYRKVIENDDGIVDMSWIWFQDGAFIGHSMLDRAYIDYKSGNWQFKIGRQRINWGINLISNPNDLFNTYSFFDFDYPERPGTDAVRVQYYLGSLSQLQFAYKPAKESKESVAAVMLNVNKWNYDIQTLIGYYHNRTALGIGWAGNLYRAGFKGEATWFYDIDENMNYDIDENMKASRGNLVAAIGMDYIFSSGTYGIIELLYNGGYSRGAENNILLMTEPLRADNIMFSEYTATLSVQHTYSSIMQFGLALMVLPDIESIFISPNAKYSIVNNLDLELVAQIFRSSKNSALGTAGSAFYLSLQYSF